LIDVLVPVGKSPEKIRADFDPRAKRPAVVPADQKK
jgi:hypothetical protein